MTLVVLHTITMIGLPFVVCSMPSFIKLSPNNYGHYVFFLHMYVCVYVCRYVMYVLYVQHLYIKNLGYIENKK